MSAATKRAKVVALQPRFARGDHVELADRMLARVEGSGPPAVFDDGALHRYEAASGLWRAVERDEQSRVVQSFAGSPVGEKDEPLKLRAPDVAGARTMAADQRTHVGWFADAPPGLAFADAFVRVTAEGVETTRHAPENRAQFGYSFAYDKRAPKLWLTFLHDVFRDDEDREEKIALVQEFFGACLLGVAPTYQRCIIAIGSGSNGKSKLGDVILACMPKGSTCSLAPQTFAHEYTRALLAGKRLNAVNELPDADMAATEQFKAIVTGEPIHARPIREAPFIFRPRAGHYFAANALPGSTDQSFGYWRRWLVLPFSRRFTEGGDADPKIAERIIAAETAPIVAWLLDGGARLLREASYTIPASHEDAVAQWKRTADQIAAFVEERTTAAPDGFGTLASAAYEIYRRWAEANGHRSVSATKFGLRMRELGKRAEHCEHGNVYPVQVKGCGLVGRTGATSAEGS